MMGEIETIRLNSVESIKAYSTCKPLFIWASYLKGICKIRKSGNTANDSGSFEDAPGNRRER